MSSQGKNPKRSCERRRGGEKRKKTMKQARLAAARGNPYDPKYEFRLRLYVMSDPNVCKIGHDNLVDEMFARLSRQKVKPKSCAYLFLKVLRFFYSSNGQKYDLKIRHYFCQAIESSWINLLEVILEENPDFVFEPIGEAGTYPILLSRNREMVELFASQGADIEKKSNGKDILTMGFFRYGCYRGVDESFIRYLIEDLGIDTKLAESNLAFITYGKQPKVVAEIRALLSAYSYQRYP